MTPHFAATFCRHIFRAIFCRHIFAPQFLHSSLHPSRATGLPRGVPLDRLPPVGPPRALRLQRQASADERARRRDANIQVFISLGPFLPHVRAHSSHIPPFKFFVLERCFFSLTRPHFSHMSEPILPISHLLNPSFWRGVFSSHSTPFLPHVRAHSSHISSFNFCVLESSPSRARPRAASPTAASASRRSTGTRSRCTPRTRASTWAICADTAAR